MALVKDLVDEKERPRDRELKESAINFAALKNCWKFLQQVESIRYSPDDRVAILWLGTAVQSLIRLSLEFGERRVLEAIPPEQRSLFVMILADAEKLGATALEEQTRLFGDWEFSPSDSIFRLLQELRMAEKEQ